MSGASVGMAGKLGAGQTVFPPCGFLPHMASLGFLTISGESDFTHGSWFLLGQML